MASYLTSIPVSIPYSWQKRLLLFALQRLDLIDIQGLDLDNLGGLTLGRRSVVELKNVSIKIATLAERAKLPSTIVIDHASVALLRLTVPADLSTDPIHVEIQGVKVSARVRQDEENQSGNNVNQRGKAAPSHKDTANRPRLSSPSMHDPGGRGGRPGDDASTEIPYVLPTSKDLAASFLESETMAEREELEAIVGSHSTYMAESVSSATSSADSDTGLGLPGGFALPTFLTNFFQGVADRLSVKLADVELAVKLEVPSTEQMAADEHTLLLRTDEVDIDSSNPSRPSEALEEVLQPPRRFFLRGLRLDLEVDPEIFSHPSSPKLDRQSLKSSSSQLRSSVTSAELDEYSPPAESQRLPLNDIQRETRQHRNQSATYTSLVASDSSSSIEQVHSQYLPSPVSSPRMVISPRDSFHYPTASRLGASNYSGDMSYTERSDESSTGPPAGLGIDTDPENLAESTLFTHDQAESMYASAISHAAPGTGAPMYMPGAWEFSSTLPAVEPTLDVAPAPQVPDEPAKLSISVPSEPNTSLEADAADLSTPTLKHAVPVVEPERIQKQRSDVAANVVSLLCLDHLKITLPAKATADQIQSVDGTSQPKSASARASDPTNTSTQDPTQSKYAASLAASRLPLQSSMLEQSRREDRISSEQALTLEGGQLRIDVDLGVCKLLVKIAAGLTPHLTSPVSDNSKPAMPKDRSARKGALNLHLGEFLVNFHEGRNLRACLGHASTQMQTDDALLSLSLREIQLMSNLAALQRLTILKIRVRHTARDVFWFIDTVNVRESIASSAVLRPHDLTISMDGERTEIFTKSIQAVVDLLLVDEVLSRGGGLDSLIDLGNSIMSTHNRMSPPQKPEVKPQPRSVRFSAPTQTRTRSDSDSTSTFGKINVRVNGAILDLIGSEASVQVKTSAIKFAMRPGAARVVVDGAIVAGPIFDNSTKSAPLYAKVKGLGFIYCETPEEKDLDRLLSLITPSNDRYDDDDDIMVDTLLMQRRKGGVIRLDVNEMQLEVRGLDWQPHIVKLSDELAKLTAVAKYLPEDDRPGVLTFALLHKADLRFQVDPHFGTISFQADLVEAANISVPSLVAAQISSWSLRRNKDDVLIGVVLSQDDTAMGPPMLMCRFIADEMEPTVRLKFTNTCLEYKVPTLLAISELMKKLQISKSEDEAAKHQSPTSARSSDMSEFARKVKVSITFRESAAALYPLNSRAKGLFLLSDVILGYEARKLGSHVDLSMKKAALLIVNDIQVLGSAADNVEHKRYFDQTDQIQNLTKLGYVPVASLSSANVRVQIIEDQYTSQNRVEVEVKHPLLFMETCADSTQTLFQILGGLSPPSAPSKQAQYRTEIVPIQDMLASFTGHPFISEPGPELGLDASQISPSPAPGTRKAAMEDSDLLGGIYEDDPDPDMMVESYAGSESAQSMSSSSIHIAPVDVLAPEMDELTQSVMVHSMLDFREGHFDQKTNIGGTAHRWNSSKNTYELANEAADDKSPLKVKVRDLHVIWNLFDGYDWQRTRDTISQAVRDIEEKAMSRRPGSRSPGLEDEEDVIGDVLFNSIYISIPANKDPRDLANAINHGIDDMMSETGSYATSTTVTATPSRQARRQAGIKPRAKKLKLNRSRQHKISFELQGLSGDFMALPPNSGEVQSSIDIRVHKLEIFDNVPTSTWKKFATYLHEAGEREVDTSMVHVEMLNVKPIPELAASEIVMKITVLPLRLHVDQDALDFMARFFEFKDESAASSESASTPPFIQRVEVNPVRLQLDYKPKKVDYAGLRSGRMTEFMNFMILDKTNITLRRVILYGVSGFDRMGIMLNNIWSPDVRKNQLPTVLAGLAKVRPLVDVASGVRELVTVPIQEYRKDGRVVRSIQKGAVAFAKTTATELINLGAKLALGTQQVLQNAEGVLVPSQQHEEDSDSETTRQISLYADQPIGIVQGLRGAYASLERDLLLARDAIVAVPGEIMASGTAAGAAKAVLKQSPTIILRPAIGATKAVGQTLLGAGNTLDPQNLRRAEDKYKRH